MAYSDVVDTNTLPPALPSKLPRETAASHAYQPVCDAR